MYTSCYVPRRNAPNAEGNGGTWPDSCHSSGNIEDPSRQKGSILTNDPVNNTYEYSFGKSTLYCSAGLDHDSRPPYKGIMVLSD